LADSVSMSLARAQVIPVSNQHSAG